MKIKYSPSLNILNAMKVRNNQYIEVLIYIFFTVLVLSTSGLPFFWDTVQLASKHAHFFYETNFSTIILPSDIDSGHIPSFGIFLAAVWKIFGRSLFVSHLSMLPFVLGIVYQSILLARKLFNEKWVLAAAVLLLADTTLIAQCTLVSPDVILIFFFFMTLNCILSEKKFWLPVALAGLVLTSMRGMMCTLGFLIAELIIRFLGTIQEQRNKKIKFKFSQFFSIKTYGGYNWIFSYFPAAIIGISFLTWHYFKTGWIGYHKNMPWSPLFEIAGIKGMFWNFLIFSWRLIDFGRVFIWLAGFYCVWHYFKYRPVLNFNLIKLFIIFIIIYITLGQTFIIHKGLSGHRYLLPIYLSFALLVFYYLFTYVANIRIKRIIFFIVLIGMLSGNFWDYPDRIAKGWDSTLGYLPYFPLWEKMITYMKVHNIKLSETGSPFPNTSQLKFINLSNNEESFAPLDYKTNKYIFYSNVYTCFKRKDLDELKNNWIKIMEYKRLQVRITLYKKL